MEFSRRGFLATMATALAGSLATFDPLRGLWVPQGAAAAEGVLIDGLEELNDLALRFAQLMVDRLADRRATVLRQVVYEQQTHVAIQPILRVDGLGPGVFERSRRVVKTGHVGTNSAAYLDTMANQTTRELRDLSAEMFAPMSQELRPGVPFTDSLVTVVGDPASGLSVRACRFKDVNSGHVLTSVELGGGQWRRQHAFVPDPRRLELVPYPDSNGTDDYGHPWNSPAHRAAVERCEACDELRSHAIHHVPALRFSQVFDSHRWEDV